MMERFRRWASCGTFLCLSVFSSSALAQYTADFQTNTISGVTSNWTGNYLVGSNTFADVLLIQNSGVLSNGFGYVGYETNSSNNTVLVTDPGSVWTNRASLFIGRSGAGNNLVISNGGQVVSPLSQTGCGVGFNNGSRSNSVLVAGPASIWKAGSDFSLGGDGPDNDLVISNGALVIDGNASVGNRSEGNSVLITDTGSVWSNSNALFIGNQGSSNRMVIRNGGLVVSGNLASSGLGSFTTSSNNYVLVTDSGSVWSNRSTLSIGFFGSGNSLVISNTGKVVSEHDAYVGNSSSSGNNSVRALEGGIWQNNVLHVGYQGSSNSLVVNGGSVLATNLTVGFNSPTCDNLVQLDSGGIYVTNATANAVLEVRNGKLILNGGTLQVDRFVMTNACAQFVQTGGTLIYGSALLDPVRDDDSDGIPNGWEQSHGFNPLNNADASADPDGDGLTNLQEFQAGSDPTNSDSALRILGITIQGGDVLITWRAGGGRTNVLQAASNLLGAFFNISPDIVISGVGDVVTNHVDKGAAANSTSRFYRVATRSTSVADTVAPLLAITSPTNDAYVTSSTLAVTGTSADASGVAGVEAHGFAATSADGFSNWVAAVTGLAPGTNTLTVLAGDNAAPANMATNTVRVIYAAGGFDGNGDGLADGWQIQYFGSVNAPEALPTADPDDDGMSNLEEYHSGTDPTNDTSMLRITAVVSAGEDTLVYFTSVNGKYYSLERCDFAGGVYTSILDYIPGNNGIQWVKDIGGASRPGAAYRPRLIRFTNPPTEDGDGDDIADWWTQFYFGHPAGLESDRSRAGDDPDGDGATNLQEFLAGTDPTHAGTVIVPNQVSSSKITPGIASLGSTDNAASVPTSLATLYSYNTKSSAASGVVQGSDDNIYGIDSDAVLRMSSDGSAVTLLFQFSAGTISNGYAASIPIEGTDGDLYGVTRLGGSTVSSLCGYGRGTVYRISTNNGALTTLHVFNGTPEGAYPGGQLVKGEDGNFYGVTEAGGVTNCPDSLCCATGHGTVYKITPEGTVTMLHQFTGVADGAKPMAGLVPGSDGNLYGTTYGGGANGFGTVFKIGTNGEAFAVLHAFAGGPDDGARPVAALVQASDGNLYGTTTGGGANGFGTVFKISTNGDSFAVLHAFTGGSDGANPPAALAPDGSGSLYGTTLLGGLGYGTLFRITPPGALTTLHQFTGAADGANPDSGRLVQGSGGYWYGATLNGGANGNGTVYRFLPATYTWSITGGTITAGLGSPMISFAVDSPCAANLSVTVTDDLGYSRSSSTNVTVSAPIPASNSPVSFGDTLTLSSLGFAGATYSWTGPNGFASTNQNPSVANVQPCHSGQYCLTVTANGCTSVPSCVPVTVAAPQPTSNSPLCSGQTLNLFAPSVTRATYSWIGPNGFTSTNQNPSISGMATDASGDYCVEVTIDGCTSGPSCVAVTVLVPPTATVSGSTDVCAGSPATIQAELTGTPPWTVTWSDGATTTTYDWQAPHTVIPSSTTTYTVTALSDANCTNGTSSGSATLTAPPPTSAVNVSNEVLVVYNSNIPDSIACKDYYISHRPGFADANVLGCTPTTTGMDGFERITTENLANQIINPITDYIRSNPDKSIHYVVLMYGMPSRVNDHGGGGPYSPSVQHSISRCLSDAGYTSGPYYEGSTCPFVATNYQGTTCLVTALNLETLADCEAYINKLSNMYRGDVIISAKAAGYDNGNYYLDDTSLWPPGKAAAFRNAILGQNPNANVTYSSNSVITIGTNIKGYLGWGIWNGDWINRPRYATDGSVLWSGSSGWWIIGTVESYNGQRNAVNPPDPGIRPEGNVEQWFAPNAWGGTNYMHTPVGAVSHVEEPYIGGVNRSTYMSLWEDDYLFVECAWASKCTPYFQAIGDPLTKQ